MLIQCLSLKEVERFNDDLVHFENQFTYSAGAQKFSITHGEQYSTFFKTLRCNIDDPLFFIAQDAEGKILGVIVGVLQNIPSCNKNAWYLCDFKITQTNQALKVLYSLLKAVKEKCYPLCERAYALSMHTYNEPNRVLNFAQRNKVLPFKDAGTINIYALSPNDILSSNEQLFVYESTSVKTIIMNDKKLDLWHVSHRMDTIPLKNIDNLGNKLILSTLSTQGASFWGRCSIMQVGLDSIDWSWLDTSDI